MAGEGDTERLVVLLEARVRDFEKNMQKASGTADRSYDRMRRGSGSATRQMETDMVRSSNRINRALATTRTEIGAFSKAWSLGGAFAGGLAGGIIGGGLAQLPGLIKGVVSSISEIPAEAKRAGLANDVFQQLGYAAERSKVQVDALTDGMKELQLRADEFVVTGKGSAAEAFARIGLTPAEVKTRLKDPADLLNEIVNRVQRLDKAAQIRIFDELFGGTGGEQFVRFIDQGTDGIARLRREAEDTGYVLEDSILQRAADIDSQFDKVARTVETKVKIAIMNLIPIMGQATTMFSELDRATSDFINNPNTKTFARFMLGDYGDMLTGNNVAPLDPSEAGRESRRARAFTDLNRQELEPIVVTDDAPKRKKSAAAMREQRDAAAELIASLEHELKLVGATDAEIAVANNLRQAGATATKEQRETIQALTESLYAQDEAQQRLNETMEFMQDASFDFASGFLSDIRNGTSAVEALGNAFDNLASRLIDMALNQLITGLFSNLMGALGGGGGGMMTGGLFANGAAFSGGRVTPFANGGVVSKPTMFPMANGAGLMGEAGPEAVMPLRRLPSGRLGVESQGGGGEPTVVNFAPSTTINVQGNTDDKSLAVLKAELDRRDRQFEHRLPDLLLRAKRDRKLRGF